MLASTGHFPFFPMTTFHGLLDSHLTSCSSPISMPFPDFLFQPLPLSPTTKREMGVANRILGVCLGSSLDTAYISNKSSHFCSDKSRSTFFSPTPTRSPWLGCVWPPAAWPTLHPVIFLDPFSHLQTYDASPLIQLKPLDSPYSLEGRKEGSGGGGPVRWR